MKLTKSRICIFDFQSVLVEFEAKAHNLIAFCVAKSKLQGRRGPGGPFACSRRQRRRMGDSAGATVEEENTRLKVALENLHKIFREKFQVVTLNDKALEALSEKKERDAKVSSLQKQLDDTTDKLQTASETIGEMQHDMKELAGELDTMSERLADTLSELDEARGVLGDSEKQIKELRSTSTLQKVSMKFQQVGFSLRKSMLLSAGEAKQSLLEEAMAREANLQDELDQERKMVAEQRKNAHSAERRIAEMEDKMSRHAAEAEEAFAAHAAMYREQALQVVLQHNPTMLLPLLNPVISLVLYMYTLSIPTACGINYH